MPDYVAHGLTIRSDIPLAGLENWAGAIADFGVIVRRSNLPVSLDCAEKVGQLYLAAPGQVLTRVPGIGRMLVTDGRHITYEPAVGCSPEDLSAHVLSTGLATIHQQRGNVVLHGASLCRAGRAYLLCGKSGAGKSTTTAHLLANGGKTLGDDVAAIGDAPDFLVHPGPRSAKLTDNALADLPALRGMVTKRRCASGKCIIPTDHAFADGPLPLGGVIVLERRDVAAVSVERVSASQAIALLQAHSFRKRFITRSNLSALLAKWALLAHPR